MLDTYTFGRTPAALYLVRRLNEINNKSLTRACAIRANTFSKNVKAIVEDAHDMDIKVGANLLRLLREDATKIELDPSYPDSAFVSQLLRNVIIGNIKQGIRRSSIAMKVWKAGATAETLKNKSTHVRKSNGDVIFMVAGQYAGEYSAEDDTVYGAEIDTSVIEDPTTPELLMRRSDRRCARQGKPHMFDSEDYVMQGVRVTPLGQLLRKKIDEMRINEYISKMHMS